MECDTNAALQASRRVLHSDGLENDFVSDVVVYVVDGVQSSGGKVENLFAERYMNGDMWFKVLLNIDTDGHCGKYVARLASCGRRGRPDDARDFGELKPVCEKMQALVLESIIEPGENRQGVRVGILPSLVRLDRVDECLGLHRDVLEHLPDARLLLRRLGFLAENGEGVIVSDLLSDRLNRPCDQMVEDRSEVVESLVNEQFDGIGSVSYVKAVDVVRTLGIYLSSEGCWITRLELIEDAPHMAELLTCPAELELEPKWWREGIYCSHEQRHSEDPERRGDSSS